MTSKHPKRCETCEYKHDCGIEEEARKQERERADKALVNLSVAINQHWPCTLNEIKYLIDGFRDDIQQEEP